MFDFIITALHDYVAFLGTLCDTTTTGEVTTQTTTVGTTPCLTSTSGGTANGAVCKFPFIYQTATYYTCTTIDNNGQLWCATTPSYDDDELWGNCQGTVN